MSRDQYLPRFKSGKFANIDLDLKNCFWVTDKQTFINMLEDWDSLIIYQRLHNSIQSL